MLPINKEQTESISHHTATITQKTSASSWVEIDQVALDHNIRTYRALVAPTAKLAPVIKSNAYGHGIELIAKLCDQHDLVDYMCVVSLREALFLRSLGIKKPLLVVSIIDGKLEDAINNNIDLVAYDPEIIAELNNLGASSKKKAYIHLKVDTGLSRLGLTPTDTLNLIRHITTQPWVETRGIFTHLAESESADQSFTNLQLELFRQLTTTLETKGINIPIKHAACSAAISTNTLSHCTFIRLGTGMYGLWPSEENRKLTQQLHPTFSLNPVLTWKTRIIQIKDIPTGSYVGYDRTHQVVHPTRIAILPVGYWDGYNRSLSSRGIVMINGQRAPILGRIAMNLSIVDITGLHVAPTDEVVLLGATPGITADDMAQQCSTINYEVVTRINPLLPRYIKDASIKTNP